MDRHDIRSGMQVIGSDGGMIGVVDGMADDAIRIREGSESAGHHVVPLAWVSRVDEHVHIDRSAALARETWGVTGAAPAAARHSAAPVTHDRRRKAPWWLWLVGAALLLLLIYLLVRGLIYSGRDPNYADDARGELTQSERESTGVSKAVDPTGTAGVGPAVVVTARPLSEVGAYLGSTDATPGTFAFEQLQFDTGSAEIRPQDAQEINVLGAALAARPTARVRIVGYADARGSASANQDLGAARAQAVAAALAAAGVAANRIETGSGGEADPQATNATSTGQQQNRRTEVVVLSR